ncbi:MAG: hypothetical protein QHH14_00320 [Clostridiales bacterium]|nr:hypothetical protein [Clostridiales bacterium]
MMKNNTVQSNKRTVRWLEAAVAALLCLIAVSGLEARLRFAGPNPYYSFLTYPQDSQLFSLRSSFSFFYFRTRGWMGHLDMPEISPSPTYVNTQESVEGNLAEGMNARAGFEGTWVSPEIMTAPYVFEFKSVRFMPLVSAKLDAFSLRSSGQAVPSGEPASLIPFSSELSQKNRELSLGFLMSFHIKRNPVGMIVNYKSFREGRPSGYLQYVKNGQELRLNRYNWGWSTVQGCNHIFGTKTNIDAFWQDAYTRAEASQLDVVLGADFKDHKLGFRFRQVSEYGDEHRYSAARNEYVQNPYKKKTGKTILRSSNLFKILEFRNAEFLFCVVGEGDFIKQRYLTGGTELLDFYREKAYALELLPILHFELDRGGFFRIGTSASFFWKDYGYRETWGKQEVYAPGWANFGWETSWERSSYGNAFTFINFTEADLELPLLESWGLLLSLDVWSHQVFSWTTRFYGTNVAEDSVYHFVKKAERENFLRESWFGGMFGLMAGKRVAVGLFLDLPVYYDKFISTDLDKEGARFKASTNAQPAIRKPVSLWALIIMRW